MKSPRSSGLCLILLMLALTFPSSAWAHGAFPEARDVQRPLLAEPAPVFVLTNYGPILIEDPTGDTEPDAVLLFCDEAAFDTPESPALYVSRDVLVAASPIGVRRSDDRWCSFEYVEPDPSSVWVREFAATDDGDIILVTGTVEGGNDVFESADLGATWTAMGAPAEGRYFIDVHAARGAAELAVVGLGIDDDLPFALWLDGDGTWAESSLGDFTLDAEGFPLIADCHPDEARCLVRGNTLATTGLVYEITPTSEAVVISDTTGDGAVVGAAYTDEGTTLIALDNGTLRRRPAGNDSWEDLPIAAGASCLASTGEETYLCGNPFVIDSYLVARSTDDGQTFESILESFRVIDGPTECPEGTPTAESCGEYFESIGIILGFSEELQPDAGSTDDASTPDATIGGDSSDTDTADSAPDDVSSGGSDSGCSAASGTGASGAGGSGGWLWLVSLLLVGGLRASATRYSCPRCRRLSDRTAPSGHET